jgi:hypothetical protein
MKVKPATMCCVVETKKPVISFFNIFQKCDAKYIKLKKGEKIITVTVQAK